LVWLIDWLWRLLLCLIFSIGWSNYVKVKAIIWKDVFGTNWLASGLGFTVWYHFTIWRFGSHFAIDALCFRLVFSLQFRCVSDSFFFRYDYLHWLFNLILFGVVWFDWFGFVWLFLSLYWLFSLISYIYWFFFWLLISQLFGLNVSLLLIILLIVCLFINSFVWSSSLLILWLNVVLWVWRDMLDNKQLNLCYWTFGPSLLIYVVNNIYNFDIFVQWHCYIFRD
jgi:hypothetical protein